MDAKSLLFAFKVKFASAPYNSVAALFSHAIAGTLAYLKRWKVLFVLPFEHRAEIVMRSQATLICEAFALQRQCLATSSSHLSQILTHGNVRLMIVTRTGLSKMDNRLCSLGCTYYALLVKFVMN
jgi:hypothetical protein